MTEMTTVEALELAKEIAETTLGFWKERKEDGELLSDEVVEDHQSAYLEAQIEMITDLIGDDEVDLDCTDIISMGLCGDGCPMKTETDECGG